MISYYKKFALKQIFFFFNVKFVDMQKRGHYVETLINKIFRNILFLKVFNV